VNPALRLAYGAAGQIVRAAAAIAPGGESKWRRSLQARRGIRARYAAWAPARDMSRPLLWMHAPSVGEGLQARVVLESVRARRPDVQLAFTFFSPSAERLARSLDVDFTDFLPFDTRGDARAVLDALRPSALVFSKVDAWPVLVAEAAARGVGLGMVSGTLSDESSRQGSLATHLLRECYARLEAVGAVSDTDASRLVTLGVRPECVQVTGDTRYDQVWQRARAVDTGGPLLAPLAASRPTLVAGSTWPADEEVLLPAWIATRHDVRDARLVVAPHEPTEDHLRPIEDWASEQGLRWARLGAGDAGVADVILVDRVGVLAELYALASAAFVGGAFHAAGIHSVLEPAAVGAPVAFGPRHGHSRDAALLARAGGARAAGTAAALSDVLREWLSDPAAAREAGLAARAFVERGTGATARSFSLVMDLVDRRGPPRFRTPAVRPRGA
jgi:3-deoxy-D-manno-octulosonic-acid transferase